MIETTHTRDARGCHLVASRESGSRLITVRGIPHRSGTVSHRLPSISSMFSTALTLASESETLDLVSSSPLEYRSPHIRTYIAKDRNND